MELKTIIDAINSNKIIFDDATDVQTQNIRLSKNKDEYYMYVNRQMNNSFIGAEEISFYALKSDSDRILAKKIGYLMHLYDEQEYRVYNLYKLELTDKHYLGQKVSAYAMQYFFEIANQKGYLTVFLNYRPTDKEDKNMYVTNENGELEHRANYLYRKNGFSLSFDDRGGAQQFKYVTKEEINNIKQNTEIINGIKVYKDIKTWTKTNNEKVNEL